LHIVSQIGSSSSKIKVLYGRIRATSISEQHLVNMLTDNREASFREYTHSDEQHPNLDSPALDKHLMHALARLKLYFMMMRSE
jgi:hypothetical protein